MQAFYRAIFQEMDVTNIPLIFSKVSKMYPARHPLPVAVYRILEAYSLSAVYSCRKIASNSSVESLFFFIIRQFPSCLSSIIYVHHSVLSDRFLCLFLNFSAIAVCFPAKQNTPPYPVSQRPGRGCVRSGQSFSHPVIPSSASTRRASCCSVASRRSSGQLMAGCRVNRKPISRRSCFRCSAPITFRHRAS